MIRHARFFVAFTLAHLAATVVLLTVSVGAAYGRHRGDAPLPLESFVVYVTHVLTYPIALARQLAPGSWAVGYGWLEMGSCSILWGIAATLVRVMVQRSQHPAGG